MEKREKRLKVTGDLKFFICFILMTIVFIVSNSLTSVELEFAGYTIFASVFVYPFVYLFSTMITKEYGREKALIAVLLTSLLQAGIYICMNLFSTTDIEALTITGKIVAFLTSQVAIVFASYSITRDTKLTSKASLFVLYVFAILVENLIFLGVFNINTFGNFEMLYAISSAIESLIALAIVYIQYLFEKERAKKQ